MILNMVLGGHSTINGKVVLKTVASGYSISAGDFISFDSADNVIPASGVIRGVARSSGTGGKQIYIYIPLITSFADATWTEVIAACQSGDIPAAWAVGNSKTMTINGTNYQVDIIGKDHDTYSDGSGTAPLTFQLHDCYGTKYAMNSSNTNSGGWTSCAMRSTHLPAILALMPSEVQAGIKEVNKLTSAGSQSSTINTTADKLFLLSEIEIFGSATNSKSGEGSQYAYYSAGNSKVKNLSGSAYTWWDRSPRGSNSTYFCGVNSTGNAYYSNASNSYGVSFAFCF